MSFFSMVRVKSTAFLVCLLALSCTPKDRYVVFSGYAQGGTYSVKFNMNGRDGMISQDLQEIKDSVDAILTAIDASLSGYNKNSILSRFNAGETVVPDSYFIDMYRSAYDVYNSTGAVVDAASAPLFDVWGFGFKSGEMPSSDKVMEVMSGCGMNRLQADVTMAVSGDGTLNPYDLLRDRNGVPPQLNYNAIAQGYSCDKVARYLYSIGVKDMMVDIGEIFCDGVNPKGMPWGIGIDKPVDGNNDLGAQLQAIFKVPAGPHGVVTSGNYRKFYVKDGRKYAHTIDPRNGYPVSHNLLSATVVAPDALIADAYATYCMVIGLEESVSFIESTPGVEGCLVYDDGGEFKTWTSQGMTLSEL